MLSDSNPSGQLPASGSKQRAAQRRPRRSCPVPCGDRASWLDATKRSRPDPYPVRPVSQPGARQLFEDQDSCSVCDRALRLRNSWKLLLKRRDTHCASNGENPPFSTVGHRFGKGSSKRWVLPLLGLFLLRIWAPSHLINQSRLPLGHLHVHLISKSTS